MKLRALYLIFFFLLAASFARAQDYVPPPIAFHPNQQVRVGNLSLHTAQSSDPAAVLSAALATVFHDEDLCCGKGSALEDRVLASGSLSLRILAGRLRGKQTLGNGRSVRISAEYLSPASVRAEQLLAPLMHHQPFLMQWNSRVYVVYGAVFDETLQSNGRRDYSIHKLLLFDPQRSPSPGELSFDRQKDDWTKVEGLLLLKEERE